MNQPLNLVPAIKEIEKIIRDKEYAFKQEIEPYKNSLAQLRQLNEACECCDGRGWNLRARSCAEDDRPDPDDPRDRVTCPYCGGTGRASPIKAIKIDLYPRPGGITYDRGG